MGDKKCKRVKNAITIKGDYNFKQTAKDILITSQLRTALILNRKLNLETYLETIDKKIYIFGIAMDIEEKKVLLEAEKIYDVEKLFRLFICHRT